MSDEVIEALEAAIAGLREQVAGLEQTVSLLNAEANSVRKHLETRERLMDQALERQQQAINELTSK